MRGFGLAVSFRADLICFDEGLVELKALRFVGRTEMAQVLNYLKARHLATALLINFGASRLQYRRFVL